MDVTGRVLVDGAGAGPLLRLQHPISFWGGVDPGTGRIVDPRHPDHGRCITGTVLLLPGVVGSSSSSSIMLELLRDGRAPAALLMAEPDAILALGVVVARELGHAGIPVVEIAQELTAQFAEGAEVRVAGGVISIAP